MKWAAVAVLLILCPVLAAYLKSSPKQIRWAAFALGFLPLVTGAWDLYFATISLYGWPGPVAGVEFALVDTVAIGILLGVPTRSKVRLLWPWLLYGAAVLMAIPMADHRIAALAYLWQIVRIVLVFAAAQRLAAHPGGTEYLLKGIFAGIAYHAAIALSQSLQGQVRASGALGANLLGLTAHFVLFPAMAILIGRKTSFWPWLAVCSAILVALLSASRAANGFTAIGVALLLVLSLWKSRNPRKTKALTLTIVAGLLLAPVALNRIYARSDGGNFAGSNEERAAFKRAAWMIIADHPLGIGPNQYVTVANVGGYSQQAGVIWNYGSRSTPVHNSYLLAWAETGIPGLLGLIALLAANVFTLLRAAFRYRRDPRSDLLLGASVALLIVAAHLFYEWLFMLFVFQYMFAAVTGVAVGTAYQLSSERRAFRKDRRPAEARSGAGAGSIGGSFPPQAPAQTSRV
jgi:O-antigen ligase